MTPLLAHDLVRKYFGCQCLPEQNMLGNHHLKHCSQEAMALRILTAMQENIKLGERYLHIASHGAEGGIVEGDGLQTDGFHGSFLRLPQRFQPAAQGEEPLLICPLCKKKCIGKWTWHGDGYNIEMCTICRDVTKSNGGNYWEATTESPAPAPKCSCSGKGGGPFGTDKDCRFHHPPAAKSGEAECNASNHGIMCSCMVNRIKPAYDARQCQGDECLDFTHKSDCAVHNEPALPNGKCDCCAEDAVEELIKRWNGYFLDNLESSAHWTLEKILLALARASRSRGA